MRHSEPINPPPFFVRRKNEKNIFGLSNSTLDRLIEQGLFPRRRKIGPGCVGTLYEEGIAALEKLARNSQEG